MNIFYISFILITLIILSFAFYKIQYLMFFKPTYKRRENLGDEFEFLSVMTDDGVELEGIVHSPDDAKETLLFFVGINHDAVGLMPKLAHSYKNTRVIAFNYRGYGKSGGRPSEKEIFLDALLVTQKVKKNYGSIYVVGFSLGSSIAAYVASKESLKAVFLIAPFDTLAKLTKRKHGFCLSWVLRYKYDNISFVKDIQADTYVYASKSDEVIYISNTRSLVTYVTNLKSYIEYDDLKHGELLWHPKMIKQIDGVINE